MHLEASRYNSAINGSALLSRLLGLIGLLLADESRLFCNSVVLNFIDSKRYNLRYAIGVVPIQPLNARTKALVSEKPS
jgi:hypothetical protein